MPIRLDTTARTGTIADAISEGFSELQELRDEMMGWKDNLEEKLSHTEKYERVSECADALDEIADCESECVPETHADDTVNWVHQKKKSKKSPYPRWLRVSNAISALEAAKNEMESIIEKTQEDEEAPEDDNLELQTCVDKLDEIIDGANSLEFPGMYG